MSENDKKFAPREHNQGLKFSDDKTVLLECVNKGIQSVVIPEGVTEIASTAFAHCSNLTSVSIPKSVISFFGNQVFMECNSLVEVKCYIETPLKYCPFFTINPNAKLYVP